MEFTVGKNGSVEEVEVVRSEPPEVFDGVVHAVERWRFTPRCLDGQRVRRRGVQEFRYRLSDLPADRCPDNFPEPARSAIVATVVLDMEVRSRINDESDALEPVPMGSDLPPPYDRIEKAYRAYANHRLDLARQWRGTVENIYHHVLDPQRLIQDDDRLSRARAILDAAFDQRRRLYEQSLDYRASFIQHLKQLDPTLDIAPGPRRVLITGRVNSLERSISRHIEKRTLHHQIEKGLRDTLNWLALHTEFRLGNNGELHFDNPRHGQAIQRQLFWPVDDNYFGRLPLG